jgi:hypothetical protein
VETVFSECAMRRTMTATALTALAILAPIAAIVGGPEVSWIPAAKELPPYSAFKHTVECRPVGQTVALAWGNRGTALGLYVYGPDGQCIGADDAPFERLDERILQFVPVEAGPYEMVVRSFSSRMNPVQMSFRTSGRGE